MLCPYWGKLMELIPSNMLQPETIEILKRADEAESRFTTIFLSCCLIAIAFCAGALYLYEPQNCKDVAAVFGRNYWQRKYNKDPEKYSYLSRKVKGVQNNIICEELINR
jgi:hypothetical protein